MDEPELAELANDITANGLRLSLTFWRPSADSDSGNGDGKTPTGDIIKREVTVFSTVKREVVTGWRYKDGASAGAPLHQYCYYSVSSSDGSSSARIELGTDGGRFYNNEMRLVPRLEEAVANQSSAPTTSWCSCRLSRNPEA